MAVGRPVYFTVPSTAQNINCDNCADVHALNYYILRNRSGSTAFDGVAGMGYRAPAYGVVGRDATRMTSLPRVEGATSPRVVTPQ